MENSNYSITGIEAQKLSTMNKVGVTLFALGILGLIEVVTMSRLENTSVTNLYAGEMIILSSFSSMLIGIYLFSRRSLKPNFRTIYYNSLNLIQKIGFALGFSGLAVLFVAWLGIDLKPKSYFLWASLGLVSLGVLIYSYGSYKHQTKGIKNNHVYFNSLSNGGILGWLLGIILTTFYIQLYWFSDSLGSLIKLFDPLSYLITNSPANQWFVYGTIYTLLILVLGVKFIIKYRHNRYQIIRTISVMFFQLVFAYCIPYIMEAFVETQGYFGKDLKNIWPLNYSFADPNQLNAMSRSGVSGTFFFFWGIVLFLVITPILTYYVGKRWYCSWVCGCGGLAETAGDSFRQLSSKKRIAWKIERWIIHSVMVFVLLMTIASLWPYFSGREYEIGIMTITKSSYYLFTLSLLLGFGALFFFLGRKYNKKALLIGTVIILLFAVLLTIGYITGISNLFYLKSTTIKLAQLSQVLSV